MQDSSGPRCWVVDFLAFAYVVDAVRSEELLSYSVLDCSAKRGLMEWKGLLVVLEITFEILIKVSPAVFRCSTISLVASS